jgi:hypothetical protein
MLYLYNLTLISLISLEWEEELNFESSNVLVPKGKEDSRYVTAIGWMTAGRIRPK